MNVTLGDLSQPNFPEARNASQKSARNVVSHKRSNKASLPRTFDVEIQFPSRGSRDVSRPFPSQRSLSFCFFLCIRQLFVPFFVDLILPERREAPRQAISTSFSSRAQRVTKRVQRRTVSSSLCEYFAPGDHVDS